MGCGRSRPQSPSHAREGSGVCEGEGEEKKGGKDGKKREGKKQTARTGTNPGTNATTNGGTGEVNNHAQRGGATCKKEGVVGVNRQSGEPMGAPSDTDASKSPHGSAQKPMSPNRLKANFSLLNGGSHSEQGGAPHSKTQMEALQTTAADKVQTHAGPAKPFHVTASQQEFFKMLDEKIEKGADYMPEEN